MVQYRARKQAADLWDGRLFTRGTVPASQCGVFRFMEDIQKLSYQSTE